MPMPDPIKIGRWFSYPDIRIAEAVNELIGVVRRHLKDSHDGDDGEAIKEIKKDISALRAVTTQLRKDVEELRALDRPRMTIQPGSPQDKPT